MPDSLNLIRNPKFRDGVKKPRSWEWSGSDGVEWSRDTADGTHSLMQVRSTDQRSSGVWIQRIRCKPKHWYRIEAVVSCDCETTEVESGAKLLVRPAADDAPPPAWTHLCSLTRTAAPHTMRAFYKTPDEAVDNVAFADESTAVIGTPDDLVARIRELSELTGGFGTVIGFVHDWANREDTLRSWDQVARYVIPEVNGMLDDMRESNKFVIENRTAWKRAGEAIATKIRENERALAAAEEDEERGRPVLGSGARINPGVSNTQKEG